MLRSYTTKNIREKEKTREEEREEEYIKIKKSFIKLSSKMFLEYIHYSFHCILYLIKNNRDYYYLKI